MSVGGCEQVLSNTLSNISRGSTSQPVYTVVIKAKNRASCDDHHDISTDRQLFAQRKMSWNGLEYNVTKTIGLFITACDMLCATIMHVHSEPLDGMP